MITTRTYLKGCDWCNAKGVILNSNPAFCGNTSFTEICPVCNGAKTVVVTEVAEMPTGEEIANSNPYPESVFIPISDETLKEVADYLKRGGYSPDALFGHWGRIVWNNCCEWFRNRMSKPNNCTGGEG